MEQLALNFDIEIKKPKKASKRVHYKTPTYIKTYKFWHINPLSGEKQYDGDEKHIFRIKTLHKIHGLIYTYCGVSPFVNAGSSKHILEGLNITAHHEDKQAEIEGTWQLSIKERLKLHIELLRRLDCHADARNDESPINKGVE